MDTSSNNNFPVQLPFSDRRAGLSLLICALIHILPAPYTKLNFSFRQTIRKPPARHDTQTSNLNPRATCPCRAEVIIPTPQRTIIRSRSRMNPPIPVISILSSPMFTRCPARTRLLKHVSLTKILLQSPFGPTPAPASSRFRRTRCRGSGSFQNM